jgi:hypothetical protein
MSKRRTTAAWRALVQGFSGSGLTVDAYCARVGTCPASFYRWREVLGRAVGSSKRRRGVDRTLAPAAAVLDSQPAPFVDLGTLRERNGRFEVRLDLGDGLILQIARS